MEDVVKKINSQIPFLREKYHVKEIGVFGSVIRNEQGSKNDIDILVEFDMPIGFFDFIRLENFLSEILKKKVDLISKRAIKSALKEQILKEVIYI